MFTINELIDLLVMTFAVGFIFKDSFPRPQPRSYDPVEELRRAARGIPEYDTLWFAILIAAPAVVFHELAHKFVALSIGIAATFHAAYTWLVIGMLLKMLNFGFIFFVPGYVSYPAAAATNIQAAIIAVAGPLTNLVLFGAAWLFLKYGRIKNKNHLLALHLTKNINLFLFIFNMIPIPPFDGFGFFYNLYKIFTGQP